MKNLADAGAIPSSNRGYNDDFKPDYDKNHPLLQIYTHVICSQRSSQKNFYRNFISLKKQQGWIIIPIENELLSSKSGSSAMKQGKIQKQTDKISNILTAPKIDDSTFLEFLIDLEDKKKLSKKDRYVFERAKLERTFKREISQQLVELNDGNKLIHIVSTLQNILSIVNMQHGHTSLDKIDEIYLDKDSQKNWYIRGNTETLLAIMFWSIGIMNKDEFSTSKLLSIKDFNNLIIFWINNKTVIEFQFNTILRGDVKNNPIKQLNFFLNLIGLKITKSKKQMSKGISSYYYGLDIKSYKLMMDLVSNFKPQDLSHYAKINGYIFDNGNPNIKSYINFLKQI
jgi:hypothetical protein